MKISHSGEYTIKKGDTLWDIAKLVYGDGSRWPEIAAANNLKNANKIKPGQVIKLPGMEAPPPLPRSKPSMASRMPADPSGFMGSPEAQSSLMQMMQPADPSGFVGSPEANPASMPMQPRGSIFDAFDMVPQSRMDQPDMGLSLMLERAAQERGRSIPSGLGSGISATTAQDAEMGYGGQTTAANSQDAIGLLMRLLGGQAQAATPPAIGGPPMGRGAGSHMIPRY